MLAKDGVGAKRIVPITLFGFTLFDKLSSELWSDYKTVPFLDSSLIL
jgi:hypothetical protein